MHRLPVLKKAVLAYMSMHTHTHLEPPVCLGQLIHLPCQLVCFIQVVPPRLLQSPHLLTQCSLPRRSRGRFGTSGACCLYDVSLGEDGMV